MKITRNICIDVEIQEKLKANPHINVSAIVNQFLKEYLEKNRK